MRIALITSEFAGLPGSGGIGTYFDHLARGLVRAGCEVEVFTSGNPGDLPEREGVRFHHVGSANPPCFSVEAGLAFRERHQAVPFDVLECGELKAEGWHAKQFVPTMPFVVRLHSPSFILNRYLDFPLSRWDYAKKIFFQITVALGSWRQGLPLRPIFLEPFAFSWNQSADWEESRMVLLADQVLVMNEEMQRFAVEYWGVARDRVSVVMNPYLPHSQYKIVSENRESQPCIGFLGRLEPRKGILEFCKALREILPEFPKWTVKIAGQAMGSCVSGSNPELVARKMLEGFERQVVFEGRVDPDKVEEWLQDIDLCVFPSLWETFSYVTLEASMAGKAIIATHTGAVPEILDGGRAGEMVKPGDVLGLANALRKLMANADLRAKLGAAARKRFEERFHPDLVMGDILEVYREAIDRAKNCRQNV